MADATKRLKALVVAYGCEPGRGSEGGAGWGMVRALHTFGDCTVLTGPESDEFMKAWEKLNPDTTLETVIVEEPWWAPKLKRHRIGQFLVYLDWQRRATRFAKRLSKSRDFDVAFHASLAAFWLPSGIVDLGIPSVWGPVGGAVTTPRKLWPLLGWRGVLAEVLDWSAVSAMSLLPSTRRTWKDATVRIAQNQETLERLPRDQRSSTAVLNHALFHEASAHETPGRITGSRGYIAWVSAMEPRKGPELAVRALANTSDDVEVIAAGDGPDRTRIERIAGELGLSDRITFEGTVSHDRALEIIQGAAVALFTGLREEGGLALAEAMLLGTPVVVLANGGAATIAESATDPDRVTLVEPGALADTIAAMSKALDHHMDRYETEQGRGSSPLLDQEAAVVELERLVGSALSIGSPNV